MSKQALNIDDNDTNAIDYQNPSLWDHQLGRQNVQGGTFTEGFTNAVAKFTFNGTEVMVYGVATPPPEKNNTLPPSVTFSIDGGSSNQVSNPTVKTSQYSYPFYDSKSLSPGEHTLQILVNNGDENWPFILDYIQYIPLPSSTGSESQSVSGTSSTASATAPAVAGNSSTKSNHVGAIVGGVIAGVVGLGMLAFAIWFYLFRLRRRDAYNHNATKKVDLLDHEPKPPAPSIFPSTTAADSTYVGEDVPYRQSGIGVESIYAHSIGPMEPSRPFSPEFGSRPASPSMLFRRPATPPAVIQRPATPPAIMHRPATPPAMFYPAPIALYPPGSTVPTVPSPLSSKRGEADRASTRTAGAPALFHADSGIRFAPPPPPASSAEVAEDQEAVDTHSDIAISEVPPEYTES
ncbi:hypothetical protein C8Q73DRAFT_787355 [Cubamyces lactineus]|nr:hypothetical protein C8Q73DRAFT_787355 [Cubamyces lactineus]